EPKNSLPSIGFFRVDVPMRGDLWRDLIEATLEEVSPSTHDPGKIRLLTPAGPDAKMKDNSVTVKVSCRRQSRKPGRNVGWMLPRYSNAFVPNKRPGSGTELWKTANDTSLEAQVGTRMSKKEKEYGIFLTVSSLLLTVSLHEHSGDWAPRWLWRML